MKNKGILLSVVGIILISSLLMFLISKNKEKIFMQDGIMFAVKVNGVSQNTFPSGTNYYVDVNCRNAVGSYIYDEANSSFKIAVGEITGNVKCNVSYTSNPKTLKEVVESAEGVMAYGNVSATTWNNNIKNLTPTYFKDSSPATSSGTTANAWTYDTNTGIFTSIPSVMTTSGSSAFYHAYAQIKEAGSYQICYTISTSTSANDMLYILIGTSYKKGIISSINGQVEGCYNLGKLTTSQYINVVEKSYSGTSSPEITFTLEKAGTKTIDAGYRYQGENPNNYVWFNNEMWRIIGSIPT